MHRLPLLVLLGLNAAASVFVLATADRLPARIATHFGAGGAPDAWMSHSGYAVFMLFFVVGLPALVAGMAGGLPRLFPTLTNIPNRHYWMAPQRRQASLDFLAAHACWLGCLIVLMASAIHWAILQAHATSPARLATATVLAIVGAFLVALAVWIVQALRRFRAPV